VTRIFTLVGPPANSIKINILIKQSALHTSATPGRLIS